ncbi:hypothetical protein J8M21_13335 [Pseudoalteromonas luteoviolacea]|uniref:class II glutamine amidotransferase n=1 Tax=Pseudoalteromonas luteoviolacea TaxID=43657 RepID=UPI001B39E34C|nr:hypothetical protein [Pseudoalteromonas luteoviolacea]MBQ4878190.1 hypothetical protein [Pseudoalteromonas luteoviolacea]MBQ4907345.1 hypothetical protein [Pseudoalteromonas luteoviolacea]
MCRMILALGNLDPHKIFNACATMSQGLTAKHKGPVKVHPNGWGAIWKQHDKIDTHHSVDALTYDTNHGALPESQLPFIAVHARHATVPKNQGIQFAHPLKKTIQGIDWYMMHNGFMPTVYKALNMPESVFDSEEYMRYVFELQKDNKFCADTLTKHLDQLDPGNSSGNTFFVSNNKVYVYQWFPIDSQLECYFSLNLFESDNQLIIASEIIPDIADEKRWRKLSRGQLLEFSI